MKPFLLYRDQDFSPHWGMIRIAPSRTWWRDRDFEEQWAMLPEHERRITQDLELDLLFTTMAREDKFLFEVVKNVILSGSPDIDTIRYRQGILKDCMQNPEIIRNMYAILIESMEQHQKIFRWSSQSIDSLRNTSIQVIELFVQVLTRLRNIADEHGGRCNSEGFNRLFAMFKSELPDEYITSIREKLKELKFPNGQIISARIGKGNKGTGYTLHRYQKTTKQGWVSRFFTREPLSQYSFTIADRDYNGFKALEEVKEKSVNAVANTLAQSSDQILAFFSAMKKELAFYIGCLNLSEELMRIGEPVCFPLPAEFGSRKIICRELYDVCLALKTQHQVVGNDMDAENKDLIIITGANRGGKSTLLRSLGLAQMMMQSGLFVPAESFSSDICTGVFTHFRREEDHSMKSGKLDEELSRMSEIVTLLKPDSMVLFNESFAATNEREGSEISRQIVSALLQRRIKVIFVTHLYEFSRSMYEKGMNNTLFLRAERKPDGERTFRVREGEPLQTSYGEDLYNRIFFSHPE